jgi:hypothetical protein
MQETRLDRSAEVAQFLDVEAPRMPERTLLATIARRWPDLSKDEYLRALDIAIEIGRATLAERRLALPG